MSRKAAALSVAFCSIARILILMVHGAGHDEVYGELHPTGNYNILQSQRFKNNLFK